LIVSSSEDRYHREKAIGFPPVIRCYKYAVSRESTPTADMINFPQATKTPPDYPIPWATVRVGNFVYISGVIGATTASQPVTPTPRPAKR
jgi:hypothetical protein